MAKALIDKTVASVITYAHWAQSIWQSSVQVPPDTSLLLMVLGLGGEAAEVADEILQDPESGEAPAGVVKELGDAFYNWAVVALAFNFAPENLFQYGERCAYGNGGSQCIEGDKEHHALRMLAAAGKVLEAYKKYVRDGVLNEVLLQQGLQSFVIEWRVLCAFYELDPADVLALSIAKLEDRLARGKLAGSGNDR